MFHMLHKFHMFHMLNVFHMFHMFHLCFPDLFRLCSHIFHMHLISSCIFDENIYRCLSILQNFSCMSASITVNCPHYYPVHFTVPITVHTTATLLHVTVHTTVTLLHVTIHTTVTLLHVTVHTTDYCLHIFPHKCSTIPFTLLPTVHRLHTAISHLHISLAVTFVNTTVHTTVHITDQTIVHTTVHTTVQHYSPHYFPDDSASTSFAVSSVHSDSVSHVPTLLSTLSSRCRPPSISLGPKL